MSFAYRIVLASSLVLSALVAVSAQAQEEDERAAAREAFERGVNAYGEERWEEALGAFQEAYRIAPHPSVRVNMANCYVHLARPVEALDHFERFLIESGDEGDPAQKREVRRQIEDLREQVGETFLRIQPEGATVTIDGHTTRRAPILDAVKLSAGTHHVEVAMQGYGTVARDFEVEGGERHELRIELEEGAAPVGPTEGAEELGEEPEDGVEDGAEEDEPEERIEADEPDDGSGLTIPMTAWIGAGATAGLVVGAVVLAGFAKKNENDFNDSVARFEMSSGAEREEARQEGVDAANRADRLALTADILGIAGVLAAGATVFFYFWDQPDSEDGMAVIPTGSQDGAGLMLTGQF
jgi:hypothetical protein